jgi:hypothetical protein
MVYVHPDHEHAKDIVRAAAMDQFGAANRYGDSPRGSEYKRALFDSLSERWTLAAVDIGALDAAAYSEGSGRAAAEREILAAVRASRRRSGAPPLRRS